jgi:hypothetical protein
MSFDFNINNYNETELMDMVRLKEPYTIEQLTANLSNVETNIFKNAKMNGQDMQQFKSFFKEVKNRLARNATTITNNEIKPNTDSAINVYPSKYYQGDINPLKRRTLKKSLNIDTRFRSNYASTQSTNFNFNLPVVFNNVVSMQLSAIELPYTFYNITEAYKNNRFLMTAYNTKTNEQIKNKFIVIPDGNYTGDGIITAINNLISLEKDEFTGLTFSTNISSDGGNGSGQVIVTNDTTYKIEINFIVDVNGLVDRQTNLAMRFGWMLGFRQPTYEIDANNHILSEGVIDMTGIKYIYLSVNDFQNNVSNTYYSAFTQSLMGNNILARISLQTTAFTIMMENNYNIITIPREYFGPVQIQNLHIQLLDEYGRIMQLNNMDFSFCINMTELYDV